MDSEQEKTVDWDFLPFILYTGRYLHPAHRFYLFSNPSNMHIKHRQHHLNSYEY